MYKPAPYPSLDHHNHASASRSRFATGGYLAADPLDHRPLQGSLASLRATLHSLRSSVGSLEAATADYPRLQRVLSLEKGFDVINETAAVNARDALAKAYLPKIQDLLAEFEVEINRCVGKQRAIMSQLESLRSDSMTEVATDTSEMNTPEVNTLEVNTLEVNTPEINNPEINNPEINNLEINTPESARATPEQITALRRLEAEREALEFQLSRVQNEARRARKSIIRI